MSPQTRVALRRYEGRHVGLQLADGSQIHDCEVVSVARRGETLWLLVGDDDRMLQLDEIADLWETA